MKIYLMILLSFIVFENAYSQKYSKNYWSKTNEFIYFANKENGWVQIYINHIGYTLKTIDGGNSWVYQKIDTNNFYSVLFLNDSVGFAKYLSFDYESENFPFYKTIDGGITWEKTFNNYDKIIDFYFFNPDTGYSLQRTVGNSHIFGITTNGGVTWDSLSEVHFDYGTAIEWVIDKNTIFLAPKQTGDWYTAMLMKSTDGGKTWRNIMRFVMGFEIASGIYGLCFADEKIGYFHFNANGPAADPDGNWKTTDGGDTWLEDPSYMGYNTMFLNPKLGFKIFNDGILYKTTDKGVTWDSICPKFWSEVTFIDEYNGFAIDRIMENDTIMVSQNLCKTTDGGYTWDCSPIVFDTSALITSIQEPQAFVTHYILEQNYPNPFNPVTKIKFSLPEGGITTIKVYDILGEEKATLLNEYKLAGSYTAAFDGNNLPSGVYIYTITSSSFKQSKKMVLMK
ncbi:MAG: T9SS type A sorting domain-containing protein [Syntrophothermus sp.]